VQPDNEDEAWRAIVENYGERPDVDPDDLPADPDGASHGDAAPGETPYDEDPWGAGAGPLREPARDDDRFVPPTPPPVPRARPDRLVAWGGLFGAPVVLLVALVARLSLPSWAGYALVAWFVGGFVYLVLQMPSGPRDPGDDGARL
jgi:hypothetical protein